MLEVLKWAICEQRGMAACLVIGKPTHMVFDSDNGRTYIQADNSMDALDVYMSRCEDLGKPMGRIEVRVCNSEGSLS